MIDECFDLAPPSWVKREWLSNPAGTDLFTEYRKSSQLFPANPQTVQGFYCMTAEGEHLAGSFARTSNAQARNIINTAWRNFHRLARERGWEPKPIPDNRFELTMGKPVERGGIKLRIASRDLPRGDNRRPGNAEWEREAYNLNWIDFPPNEAARFVTNRRERSAVPESIVQKLAMQTLKDNVRGQCGWHKGAFQSGEMFTELIETSGLITTVRLTGYAVLREQSRVVAAQLHGQAGFDTRSGEFMRFEMVASGQREGAAGANGRNRDLGPAPIGMAYTLYQPPK